MGSLTGKLYTAEQVRRLDRRAIDDHDIPGKELMQRAGQAAFNVIRDRYPEARKWLVVCGAGNNGGDGYVIAALAASAGLEVKLIALKKPAELTGDAAGAAAAWLEPGRAVSEWPAAPPEDWPEVVVDALLGTGLDRELGGAYFDAVAWINKLQCPRIAVDIPSGLNADSGCRMGLAVAADLTISFIGLKRGLFTSDGPDCAGQVVFDDLQAPSAIYDSVSTSGELIRENIIGELLGSRRRNTHKGHYGHVLVAGGDRGMSGAPRLAGEAALRSGAGLVSIATHPEHAAHLNAGRPELMVHACQSAGDLDNLLERAAVIALGPGLGTGEWSSMLFGLCQAAGKPLIVDADGLNLMAGLPESERRSGAGQVLTPHPAEAARLLQTDTPSVQDDRVHSALELARRFEATVVLKGSGSVIAGPDGRYAICALGNPGMATAGSGDTLTGIIAAFMAQGLDAWRAACLGVVVHAAAGDLAAERLGQRSMLAGDITDHLHLLLR